MHLNKRGTNQLYSQNVTEIISPTISSPGRYIPAGKNDVKKILLMINERDDRKIKSS
jgi:hypothetical protein